MISAGEIQISEETNRYLTKLTGGYKTRPRGEVIVKGKGVMFTYWLEEKIGDARLSRRG